jgi:hypothetical protein
MKSERVVLLMLGFLCASAHGSGTCFSDAPKNAATGITVRQANNAKLWQTYHGFGEKPLTWRWHESATCAYLTVTCLVERTVVGPVAIQREAGAVSGEYDLAAALGDVMESSLYDVVIADFDGDDELFVRSARIAVLPKSFELKKVSLHPRRTKVDRTSVSVIPYDKAWTASSADASSAGIELSTAEGWTLSLPLPGTEGFVPLDMQSVAFGQNRCADLGLIFDGEKVCSTSLVLRYASVFLVR